MDNESTHMENLKNKVNINFKKPVAGMKNTFDRPISIPDTVKERINEMEGRPIKSSQTENKKKNKITIAISENPQTVGQFQFMHDCKSCRRRKKCGISIVMSQG